MWERAEEFVPERFSLDGPVPNETNTDFRYSFTLNLSKSEENPFQFVNFFFTLQNLYIQSISL